jgi:predicted dehydrogenase
MADKKLRFGIIGCAGIAKKNVLAIKRSHSCKVVAVASRSLDKAVKFIEDNFLSKEEVTAYGSYDELLASSSVDAVYIPLPTVLHLQWVTRAAEAGKHVLLEKPTAPSLGELKEIIAVCQKHNVIFMDGVMYMHHDRTKKLFHTLWTDPLFQPVQRVQSSFTFHGDSNFLAGGNSRTSSSGDPLGALGDLGWYCIRLGIMAFGSGIARTFRVEYYAFFIIVGLIIIFKTIYSFHHIIIEKPQPLFIYIYHYYYYLS